MKNISGHQIRSEFIDYFAKNGHAAVSSSSLIPENDATLLFANAGMNQFKNLFLGLEKRNYTRAVTSQKCVRAGGKHNDLENVGFTARHHTFFEMLGNFSFGDYFKKDAIHFAWEFLTKTLEIPKERLYITVFQNDDEAADIWHKQESIPRDRIFRFGEKDNFWRMGDTGPCGPCTEIFFDHGPAAGKESDPFKGIAAGEDRFVEIWNLVFMQFDEQAPGKMIPLPKPSVDTGSGLERVTAALQRKMNNYDTDLFWPMITRTAQFGKVDLEKAVALHDKSKIINSNEWSAETKSANETLAALRVIADHVRSSSMLIADGALPSNEGRGYVLRRILRRAIRFGRKINPSESIIPVISECFIGNMAHVYPELNQRRNLILSTLKDEENRFVQTLDQGTHILNNSLEDLRKKREMTLPGEVVFKLYDTYGFPVDLTRVMAEENGFKVDEASFERELAKAKEIAKASWKGKAISADDAHIIQLSEKAKNQIGETKFHGYEKLKLSSPIAFISNGSTESEELSEGKSGFLIFKDSCFYAESGGQTGDHGEIVTSTGSGKLHSIRKSNGVFIHFVDVEKGVIKKSQNAELIVSTLERKNTAANHSATHLLHASLRKVLGDKVTQAGSLVDAEKLRFDFTYHQPISEKDLVQIEDIVNAEISQSHKVITKCTDMKTAVSEGALALFGEKYGDEVRMLKMGEFSIELCGGTHVENTSQIRFFKIVSETGVSAGVRRIEAIGGDNAVKFAMRNTRENLNAKEAMGLREAWLPYISSTGNFTSIDWIENQKNNIKKLERDLKNQQAKQVNTDEIIKSNAKSFEKDGIAGRFVFAKVDLEEREVLSQISDQIRDKLKTGITIIAGTATGAGAGKPGDVSSTPLLISVSKDLSTKVTAGDLFKKMTQITGGKGGGRPDFAQGAISNADKLQEAIESVIAFLGAK